LRCYYTAPTTTLRELQQELKRVLSSPKHMHVEYPDIDRGAESNQAEETIHGYVRNRTLTLIKREDDTRS
jgi:hypothetical protein